MGPNLHEVRPSPLGEEWNIYRDPGGADELVGSRLTQLEAVQEAARMAGDAVHVRVQPRNTNLRAQTLNDPGSLRPLEDDL